jgi:hypothetical protein
VRRVLAAVAPVAAALVLVACQSLEPLIATLERVDFEARLEVSGWTAVETHGYLCPDAPGSDVAAAGTAGHEALLRAGCLDLGRSPGPTPDSPGWRATIHLESLASAQLEAFAGRSLFHVVLVGPSGRFVGDVPAVNLVP